MRKLSDITETEENELCDILETNYATHFIKAWENKTTYVLSIHKMIELVEWLKSKGFVNNPSSNLSNKKTIIGVISLDTDDFINWIKFKNLIVVNFQKGKKIETVNAIYYKISNVYDLCAIDFTDIFETKYAKENKNYEEINSVLKSVLK